MRAHSYIGRSRTRNNPDGSTSYTKLPREQWMLLKNAHPGYISWEQYEENLQRLRENAHANGQDRRKSPPREGPALLQGLVVCGVCGSRMTVRYHARQTRSCRSMSASATESNTSYRYASSRR